MKKASIIALLAIVSMGPLSAQGDPIIALLSELPKSGIVDLSGIPKYIIPIIHKATEVTTISNTSSLPVEIEFLGCIKQPHPYLCKKVTLAPNTSITYRWGWGGLRWGLGQGVKHVRLTPHPDQKISPINYNVTQIKKPIVFTGSIAPTPAKVPLTKEQQEEMQRQREKQREKLKKIQALHKKELAR